MSEAARRGIPGGSARPAAPEHRELAAEQRHLERAYELLGEMERRTEAALADAAARAPGNWDATVAAEKLAGRLATLSDSGAPLCFGRIDEEPAPGSKEQGTTWHIGRRHVEDSSGEPVVVDWRAPVAVPFYRATYRDPLGLWRRRRYLVEGPLISDLVDERFDDPDASSLVGAAGLPDPLLAELGRARTGTMRDIVATIAAEQDRIIRAPLGRPVVVQGGPGTGKTAVGLHRAAWLLYEHRDRLERQGLLVLGPNPVFLSYVSEVLPSLGEVAVSQTTLAGLASSWRVSGREPAETAALKGREEMAELLERAARAACRPPGSGRSASTPWGALELSRDDFAELLEVALASGGAMQLRRGRFQRAVVRRLQLLASDRLGSLVDAEAVARVVSADRELQQAIERAWPTQSPAGLLRQLYGKERLSRALAAGLLEPEECRLLQRRPARSVREEPWTAADLPLLDEARALLAGPPRRYGHVVVDEAQDLSPMALRMVARRCGDARSITILGDLAQATQPGAVASWERLLSVLSLRGKADVDALTVGYRVPRPIMEVANALLAALAPDLPATESVRPSPLSPTLEVVEPSRLAESVARQAASLLASHPSVAAVAPPGSLEAVREGVSGAGVPLTPPKLASAPGCLTVLDPDLAKGLEFDAVVVVEPEAILAGPGGAGLLYIAFTRAVQELAVVSSRPLGPLLAAALAPARLS